MIRVTLLFISMLFSGLAFGQSHHDQTPADPLELKKLTESFYVLYGRGGNVGFFIGPDAVVAVDAEFRDLGPGAVQKIKSVTDKPIRYLINTHHHIDHAGGNEYFLPLAMIIAHDNVRKRVFANRDEVLREYPEAIQDARSKGNEQRVKQLESVLTWARNVKVDEVAAPFLTFDSEFRIYLGGEIIHVWHTAPAHTDGDSVVYFEKEKVLHMGDLLFYRLFPFIDVDSGGSARGYLKAIDQVISRVPADVSVIPGHGQVTNLDGLKEFRTYIQDLIDAAVQAKKAGKSKEEFLKTTLPQYQQWSKPERFPQNAGAAFDEAQ